MVVVEEEQEQQEEAEEAEEEEQADLRLKSRCQGCNTVMHWKAKCKRCGEGTLSLFKSQNKPRQAHKACPQCKLVFHVRAFRAHKCAAA